MKIHKYVQGYIKSWRSGKIKFNKERQLLVEYLEEHIFPRKDLYFDEKQIDQCVRYIEKWYFPLQPFQKFVISFVFLKYKETDRLFYRRFLIMMGRGGGKNGLISGLTNYLNSELHGIPQYHISIVANSEDQAKTSFEEVYNTIDAQATLKKSFYLTKLRITNKKTQSWLRFRTSNADTKDGGQEGAVVFDEIHQYEDRKTVNVFKSGLGKKKHPREIYIGTDGYVREGFLDAMKEQAWNIITGKNPTGNMFAFICKLDEAEQVHDPDLWELANPMFSHPRSEYAQNLFETVYEEYQELDDDPSGREELMTKRMNFPETDLKRSVASVEEIKATNRPFPPLDNLPAVGGLDFASIRDFAAVGLLFRVGEDYVWKTHSFVRKGFLDMVKLKPPIYEWQDQGLLTIVDEPTIGIRHIVDWFVEQREKYNFNTIVADNFRLDLVRTALEAEGFDLIIIRNPKAAHALLAPRIETMFANKHIIFGDNPLQRWYVNNVLVNIKKDGNKEYLKKDEVRRKTDGFQAMVHALWSADDILEQEVEWMLDDIAF